MEVWKLLFHNPRHPKHRHGIVATGESPHFDKGKIVYQRIPLAFKQRFQSMHRTCRATKRTPWQWHQSRAWKLGKLNGNQGPHGIRLIHGIPTCAKAFYKGLWIKQDLAPPPPHMFAVKGRRREEAIATHNILQYKLAIAQLPIVTEYGDVANAFPFISQSAVVESIPEARDEIDASFFTLHVSAATFKMEVRGEDIQMQPWQGFFAGSPIASDLFWATFGTALQTWVDHKMPNDELLTAVSPTTNTPVSCGVTTFVDDVSRKMVPTDSTAIEAISTIDANRNVLTTTIADIDIKQNESKGVSQVRCNGKDTRQQYALLYNRSSPTPGHTYAFQGCTLPGTTIKHLCQYNR